MVRLDPCGQMLSSPDGSARLTPCQFRLMCAFIKAGFNQPVETAALYRLGWPEQQPSYLPGSLSTEIYRLNQILDRIGGARVVNFSRSASQTRVRKVGRSAVSSLQLTRRSVLVERADRRGFSEPSLK